MAWMIDTDVAIHLRDHHPAITERLRDVAPGPSLSIISQVELENGILAQPALARERRLAVDLILANIIVHPFDADTLAVYRSMIAEIGYSRPRVADRMIAATAIAHGLTLITLNGRDFRGIPRLRLEIWPSPD